MASLPFLGRLRPWEYIMLVFSLIFLILESFVRFVTLALPSPIFNLLYRLSRRAFNQLSSHEGRKSRSKKKALSSAIAKAQDFIELCEFWGYQAEEHIVQTKDGYLLGIHRLAYRPGQNEEEQRVNAGKGSISKKVVYLHHGLMMSSEVWCCLTEKEKCLPFTMVDKGYDVWLGNNRGNKYSKKSNQHSPTDPAFWSFSIDQFAFHDIPDSVDYILRSTRQPTLTYVGFSQGTAQAFAALSIHPQLNEKVNCFIALAPAMAPPGLADGIVASLVKTSPDVLFLAFGRRAMLTSTTMWQALLYPPIFIRILDMSLSFLFNWKTKNITAHQKLAAYPHLYSFTSVKSVVHWFQIIRNGTFQMYDDDLQSPLTITDASRYYKVARFPTKNIRTPIVLVYGGSDSLVNIDIMTKELPKHTTSIEVPHYEHLDFLWAHDVDELVFPHVFDALEKYANVAEPVTDGPRRISPRRALTFSKTIDRIDNFGHDDADDSASPPYDRSERGGPRKHTETITSDREATAPKTPRPARLQGPTRVLSDAMGSAGLSHITERTSTSRPEGWWSSDNVTEPNTPVSPKKMGIEALTQQEPTGDGAKDDDETNQSITMVDRSSPAPEDPITAKPPLRKSSSQSSTEATAAVTALRDIEKPRRSSKASFEEKGIRLGVGKPSAAVQGSSALGSHIPVSVSAVSASAANTVPARAMRGGKEKGLRSRDGSASGNGSASDDKKRPTRRRRLE